MQHTLCVQIIHTDSRELVNPARTIICTYGLCN